MTATPTGIGPKRSPSVASPTAAERPVDGEARGSRAAMLHGSEKKRRVRSKGRITGAHKGIEGKVTTPSLSTRSDFARTTVRNPARSSCSSSCRHSWFFKPPPGRFHVSNSQTVRAISVTPNAENSRAIWHINSSSSARNVRPQKLIDSCLNMEEGARGSVAARNNVQDHAPRRM